MSAPHTFNGDGVPAEALAVRSPRQRAILNVIAELGHPISTTDIAKMMGDTLGATAHHMRALAREGLIEWAGERRVRGALQTFYVISEAGQAAQQASAAALLGELFGVVADTDGQPVQPRFDRQAVEEVEAALRRLRPEYVEIVRRAAGRRAA